MIMAGTAMLPITTLAQQPRARIAQIGYLGNSSPKLEAALLEGFHHGLREHGYIEGSDVVIHFRWALGDESLMPSLAAELAALNVDVIVVSGTTGARSAIGATRTIPIVLASVGNAVGTHLVLSLARPGGNVTGLSTLRTELEGKRLEVLTELVPGIKRIAGLMNPYNPITTEIWQEATAAAAARGISAEPVEVSTQDQLDPAFAAIVRQAPDAIVVVAHRAILLSNRKRIIDFAARQRLPAVYPFREFVDDGGLLCYGLDFADMFRRAAGYVDKILKGATPSSLPLEQPSKIELVINLKTAKALGLAVPPMLLARADEVIE